MKRIITFMMALALVLSLSVTAFAAVGTDGTITITNTTIGDTYEVYKIFDATYDDDSDAVTYTIDSSNPFFTKMFGTDGTANNECFNYYAETGVVKLKDGITNDALFTYLAGLIKEVDPTTSIKAEDTTHTFSGLNYGYYVIARENGKENAVTITNVNKDATVIDKNQLPGGDFDKKADKDTDGDDKFTASVGDTINWTLEFTATNYDDDQKVAFYTIKDTLTPEGWAAIDLSRITITVGDKPLVKDTDWELLSGTTNGFEVKIPWMDGDDFIYDSTAKVVITYPATVLDAAASNNPTANKNEAGVDWVLSNGTNPPDAPGDETETEVYNMGFTKVDGTDATKTLPGAEFKLTDANGDAVNVSATSTEGVYIVDPESTSNLVVTPANGQVVIMGLAEGTYTLEETKAPEGYNMLTETVSVTVSKDAADELTYGEGESAVTYKLNNAALDIANNSGVELPSTGGMGTMMMISFGTMVAIAFAVLMITQKKMSIYRD